MKLMRRMKGNLGGNRKKFAFCVCDETFDVEKNNKLNKLCRKLNDRTFVSILCTTVTQAPSQFILFTETVTFIHD